ncbi:hypothetical protein LTR70_000328 [Exophiala xenobiotica]|uniref:Uncharacterized protein n=1 Tax=Lithohypha guttulata TaxID=1690604 RepID=A0ABR0KPK7_9EURO|nr:hypothetical protein LTR24_000031 [Lithohypha guttulata]KAK5330498.1 hypothetical protein LTR70_000328 [Exophiala xenobiotica]
MRLAQSRFVKVMVPDPPSKYDSDVRFSLFWLIERQQAPTQEHQGPSQDVENNIKPNVSNQVSLEIRLGPDTGINNRSSVGDAENPLFSSPAQSGPSPDEAHDTPITSPVSSDGGTEKKESYMSSVQGVVPSEAPDDSVIRQPFTGEGKKVYSTNHKLSNLVNNLVVKVKDYDAVSSLEDGTKFMCCISDISQEGEHIEGTKQIGVTRQADCVIVAMDRKCPLFRGPRIPDTYIAFNVLSTGEWQPFECRAGLDVLESIEPQDMYYVEELLREELLVKINSRNKLKVSDYLAGDVVVDMM